MSVCHQAQLRAVETIRRLDNSAAFEPTTSTHRHSTTQLELALNKYVSIFLSFVISHLFSYFSLRLLLYNIDKTKPTCSIFLMIESH